MAAITPVSAVGVGTFHLVRNATAQATTGQTDWLVTPAWAKAAVVHLNWRAKSGTTPLMDFKIVEADPVARDDAYATDLDGWDGITQLTAEDLVTIRVGPHRTSLDDTGVDYHVGTILPPLIGLVTTLDRTTGDETYTYTLSVTWIRG